MPGKKKYELESIFDVVLAFGGKVTYEQLLNVILIKLMDITLSDGGTLYINEGGKLHFRLLNNISMSIFHSVDNDKMFPPIVLDEENIDNAAAYCALKNEIIVIDDVYDSARFNFQGPKNFDLMTGYRTKSMMVLPLAVKHKDSFEVLGVIQLINALNPETGHAVPYGNIYDPPVIPALTNIASNTLTSFMRVREMGGLLNRVVSLITHAIDERSAFNSRHTEKVVALVRAFASYLNIHFPASPHFFFDEARMDELLITAALHDIGKISTPLEILDKADRMGARMEILRLRAEIKRHQIEVDVERGLISATEANQARAELDCALALIARTAPLPVLSEEDAVAILKLKSIMYRDPAGIIAPIFDMSDIEALTVKRGTLTEAERQIVQAHASTTGTMLEKLSFSKYYRDVPRWARSHHEMLDGSGYPAGLYAEDISIEVRIITIMDIFEALTAQNRPYKEPMSIPEAIKTLTDMAKAGKLDEKLVVLFAKSEVWVGIV